MQVLEHSQTRLSLSFRPTKGLRGFWALAAISGALLVFALIMALLWMVWVTLACLALCLLGVLVTRLGHRALSFDAEAGDALTEWGLAPQRKRFVLRSILSASAEPAKIDVPFHYQNAHGTRLFFETPEGAQPAFPGLLPDQEGTRAAEEINAWLSQHRGQTGQSPP